MVTHNCTDRAGFTIYDFIVGFPTIRKYKLAKVFDYIFEEDDIMNSLGRENYSAHVVGPEESEKIRETSSAESTCHRGERKQQAHLRRLVSSVEKSRLNRKYTVPRETVPNSDPTYGTPTVGSNQSFCVVSACSEQGAKCPSRAECTCSKQRLATTNRMLSSTEVESACDYVDQQSQARIATYLCSVQSLDNHRQSYLNRLELNDLYNVKLNRLNLTFNKSELLDMEEDDDPLEDFLEDTPLDRWIQAAKTSQQGVDSIEFSGKEQFKL